VKTCVVDASVAAKWLLPAGNETFVDRANRLLSLHLKGDFQLQAPDLIFAELGNVCWKAVRRGRTTRSAAEGALRRFTELAIEIVPASDLILPAWSIAVVNDRSFYDSLYVALAFKTKTELITADERLVNALGSRFPVRWLGAF
jgi:predicted nucleic acid-binding protein